MSPWAVAPGCTPACVTATAPRVPATEAARRCAALARTVARSAALGERLTEPAVLRGEARAVLRALDVRTDPPGRGGPLALPGPTGTLVVANHISWLDVVVLLAAEPMVLLAKREVAAWPVVGALARRIGTRFIDRDGIRHLPLVVRELAAVLRSGRSVVVFPQATTWCTVPGGTFRRATFQAAVDAGAPVRPVTLDYLQRGAPSTVAAFLGDEGFGTSLHRVARAEGLYARITAHPPLTGTDRRTLAAEAQRSVRRAESPVHA
ncbi:lysophospholipid acyltransferase family protein [Streptomyces sp. NPDC015131]|uniref:lysophospholipid acyltransferase family protein n=1 Tax=Streptomyces sp. NPDC015131 TaxID=3364941 RepID=UPI0036F4ED26